mmetsp:Transcript_11224/g.29933  ORF Transcript_11224/g.29933 Transcript_11224/m.29933 type:complete len:283 (-) Transcript_11224:1792-2640(-)
MASGDVWTADTKCSVASTEALTFSSASSTTFATSWRIAAARFSARPFLASAKVLAALSKRVCNSVSAFVAGSLAASPRRFAARRRIARNVFAPPTEACAVATDASSSTRAFFASASCSSSGTSTATTACTASSAADTRFSDSSRMTLACSFSLRSRIPTIASSRRDCASATRGCSFANSPLAMSALRACCSMSLPAAFTKEFASAAALSAACFFSSTGSPSASAEGSPTASARATALLTRSSADLSRDSASSTAFFAARRWSTDEDNFLHLPTSDCAVVNRA